MAHHESLISPVRWDVLFLFHDGIMVHRMSLLDGQFLPKQRRPG